MANDVEEVCGHIARKANLATAQELFASLAGKPARTKIANRLLLALTRQDFFDDESFGNAMQIATLCISQGASANYAPEDRSVFDSACAQGHLELIKLLASHDAHLNPPMPKVGNSPSTATPLMLAIGHGHEDVVDFLLAAGADIEAVDVYGETPLFWAVEHGQHDIRKLLYEHGARVDLVDNARGTLLHKAINAAENLSISGLRRTLCELAQWGVNPDLKNNVGDSAWDLARDLDTSPGVTGVHDAISLGVSTRTATGLDRHTPLASRGTLRRSL